jgi:dihydrofolate reductase
MRKLVITENVTLDGSIEMLTDWFNPAGNADADESDLIAHMQELDVDCDAVLLGRQTFTDFRGYWPHARSQDDPGGVSDFLNQVQKYVVSNSLTDPEWENSTILEGDTFARIRQLKNQPGKDIVVTGSISLCHALIDAGLVDEYRLYIYPSVQGRGRRLFPDGFEMQSLRLIDARPFASGVCYVAYQPALPPADSGA